MSTKHTYQRMVSLAVVIAILAAGLALFTYLQIVMGAGFTGPRAGPVGTTAGMLSVDTNRTTVTLTGELTMDDGLSGRMFINNVKVPELGHQAVSKDYVDTKIDGLSGAGGGGAGSAVFYYKTVDGTPVGTAPTCADTGLTEVYTGYGPHYLGVVSVDWYYQGTGGYGGGYGASGDPVPIDPAAGGGFYIPPTAPLSPPSFGSGEGIGLNAGYSFVTNDIAFASDSVCSTSRQTTIPTWVYYLNATTSPQTTLRTDACSINGSGELECNRCVVCSL